MIKYNSQFGNLTKQRNVESAVESGLLPIRITQRKAYEDRERVREGVVKCGVAAS